MHIEDIHQKLQTIFKREILLRHEILSHFTELTQTLLNTHYADHLLYTSHSLVHRLKEIVHDRGSVIRLLIKHLPSPHLINNLEELLHCPHYGDPETIFLYKKNHLLIQKIHEKHLLIKTLLVNIHSVRFYYNEPTQNNTHSQLRTAIIDNPKELKAHFR